MMRFKRKKREIPSRIKLELARKFGRVCQYCGKETDTPCADHIVPESNGGAMEPGNFTLACKACNSAKHNRSLEAFRRHVATNGGCVFTDRQELFLRRIGLWDAIQDKAASLTLAHKFHFEQKA